MSTIQASKLSHLKGRLRVRVICKGVELGIIELCGAATRYHEALERTGDVEHALGAHLFGLFVMEYGALQKPGWAMYAEGAQGGAAWLDVERVHQGWSVVLAQAIRQQQVPPPVEVEALAF